MDAAEIAQAPTPDQARTVTPTAAAERPALPQGTIVAGRYLVAQRLGSGGSGDVHAAIDLVDRRGVALKVAGVVDDVGRARLEREARLGALLRGCPGVVHCLHSGTTADGRMFLVHPLVEGATPLYLTQGPLDARLGLLAAAAERVVTIHAAGVIHRDLKPANFLHDSAGQVHLVDFGLAKQLGADDVEGDRMLTQAGDSLGTPAFMPIEQFENAREADTRADVYALGVMLFLATTGRMPYEGGALRVLTELIRDAHSARGAPRPRQVARGVPPELDELCARAMQLRPARRIESAARFLEELARARAAVAAGPPPAIELLAAEEREGVDEELLDRTIGVDRTAPLLQRGRPRGDGAPDDTARAPLAGQTVSLGSGPGERTIALDKTQAPDRPAGGGARPGLLAHAVGATIRLTARDGQETDWVVVEPLGRGGMGEAWLLRRAADSVEAALKLSLTKGDLGLEIERRITEQLDHPNVVGYLGTGPEGSLAVERAYPNPLLLLDSVTPPSSARTSRYTPLPPGVALELAYDLLRGIAYLHSLSFVHHDVKVGNFLIVPVGPRPAGDAAAILEGVARSRYRGVLIDLGGARSFEWLEDLNSGRDTGDLVPPQLTPVLAPPEALVPRQTARGLQSLLLPSTDLYAAGLTIYMLITGRVPYDHVTDQLHRFEVLLDLKQQELAGKLSALSRAALEAIPLDDVLFVSTQADARASFFEGLWAFLASLTGPFSARPTAAQACATFAERFQLRGGDADPRPRQGIFSMDFGSNRLAAAAAVASALGRG